MEIVFDQIFMVDTNMTAEEIAQPVVSLQKMYEGISPNTPFNDPERTMDDMLSASTVDFNRTKRKYCDYLRDT